MDAIKRNIPNAITVLRIIGTLCLLFVPVLSPEFFIIYTFAGITDVLDGVIARKCGTVSRIGAVLDSIADLLYYAVMLIVMFPTLWRILPKVIWLFVLGVILVRLSSYITVAVRYHTFGSLHTYLNKASGFFVFSIPFFIATAAGEAFCFSVCAVTGLASLEELIMHLTEKKYDQSRHSIFERGSLLKQK